MSKTFIGLDTAQSEMLASKLNELLATYQVFTPTCVAITGILKTSISLNYMQNLRKFILTLWKK
ncbi:hypothetical protein AANUM_1350 [Aggregatibacter actinomycetemcomitans NUM4039]|nr:hypothetical protein AANUM_1350 [Aggregatibacter actinomycetemcomitans NUM4039]